VLPAFFCPTSPALLEKLPQALLSDLGEAYRAGRPIGFILILTSPRSAMLWTAFGIFGWPFCGPSRQVRRKSPFARSGSCPKRGLSRYSGISSRRISSRSCGVNGDVDWQGMAKAYHGKCRGA
jgi:hypothetical protein